MRITKMKTLYEKPRGIGAALTIVLLFCGCATGGPSKHVRTAGSRPWWTDQINVMSWATLAQPDDRPYLAFAEALQSEVADRGIYYGHFDSQRVTADPPKPEEAPFFHQHGLKVTAFLSVRGWRPSADSLAGMIDIFEGYVDAGCDGIHLDMLFQPGFEENIPDAVRCMREVLHGYGW